jgi:hypothetical protein
VRKPIDTSHGYNFNEIQQKVANEISLKEFKKPVKSRITIGDIVRFVKNHIR